MTQNDNHPPIRYFRNSYRPQRLWPQLTLSIFHLIFHYLPPNPRFFLIIILIIDIDIILIRGINSVNFSHLRKNYINLLVVTFQINLN